MARTKQKNSRLKAQIGQAIRLYRETAGMTQAALAEAAELQPETISRFETGERLPSIEKLVEIADALRVPVTAFFEHVEDAALQPQAAEFIRKINAALDRLPEEGKSFVLEVAQNYARYHLPKKNRRPD